MNRLRLARIDIICIDQRSVTHLTDAAGLFTSSIAMTVGLGTDLSRADLNAAGGKIGVAQPPQPHCEEDGRKQHRQHSA